MAEPAPFELDPRLAADSSHVAKLRLCDVRLMNDARWPWLVLVPQVPGARDLIDLPAHRQLQLWQEIDHCSRVLHTHFRPHKLNVAALGNVVAQLHVHVIARQTTDAAWPKPVWGIGDALPYTDAHRTALLAQLQPALANV